MRFELTLFQGRAGDHNDLAMAGARSLAIAMQTLLKGELAVIGTPKPALNMNWDVELESARSELAQLQARINDIYARGWRPLSATSRCAASIATLPAVVRHHPDACVVWFDAHADLNTPLSTTSGYLGGLALSASLGLWESGFGNGLSFGNVVLIGQRDMDPFELEVMRDHNIKHIPPNASITEVLREAIDGRSVYVHLDCDVLDPGIVPTDYIHDGGLSLNDLREAMIVIGEHSVIGIEVAEFQDAWAPGGGPVSPSPLLEALLPAIFSR
ncbi:arginase family protein [Rubrivivax benzoatilyticus]|uniref:Arginase family protein n=1 Tax=Rubrivivax benzoatilyticus TaxID=316997 RepID=A0ABX0HSM6_9BURK|nr:arginase family protein [Rubrivivax benzoatilyticus]NHK98039.1 arginase family protein [Rubrivivax benzoatilyticus]NHL23541.1 arginase family protein [Rubrivivax benzoatilyticus]